ncbi:hypothetical protein BLNAU_20996 [Blattamonas nauphoetae]|uniref:SET domain-containing protein n=1 Tax=Blattamonas nauphoetae TaxID=2049346 RepID=A0ABQ9WY68_9EUKA|nr:hypothetical protein BLNAU_20996 [Blattamonas nauphoetae]
MTEQANLTFSSPFGSSCSVESFYLRFTKERGMDGIAPRDFDIGEVIIDESPYCYQVCARDWQRKCHNCLRRMEPREIVRCSGCNKLCYCSKTCRDTHFNVIHKWECSIISGVDEDFLREEGHRWIRAMMKIRKELTNPKFGEIEERTLVRVSRNCEKRLIPNEEELKQFNREALPRIVTPSCLDLLRLMPHLEDWTPYQLEKASDFASSFLAGMDIDPNSPALFYEGKNALEECLLVYGILKCNSFECSTLSGTFPRIASLNHSCCPNCFQTTSSNNTNQTVALRKIQKGEVLSISYIGPDGDFEERGRELGMNWFFDCDCSRCTTTHSFLEEIMEYERTRKWPDAIPHNRVPCDILRSSLRCECGEMMIRVFSPIRIYETAIREKLWAGLLPSNPRRPMPKAPVYHFVCLRCHCPRVLDVRERVLHSCLWREEEEELREMGKEWAKMEIAMKEKKNKESDECDVSAFTFLLSRATASYQRLLTPPFPLRGPWETNEHLIGIEWLLFMMLAETEDKEKAVHMSQLLQRKEEVLSCGVPQPRWTSLFTRLARLCSAATDIAELAEVYSSLFVA